MNKLLGIAVFLVTAWLILRIALAITSGLIHLLWIVALVLGAMWIVGKLRPKKNS
jgi:hypothetical protein